MTATFTPHQPGMPAALTVAFRLDETRACQFCEALPGHSCVTRSGRRLRRPHKIRVADCAAREGERFVIPVDGGGTVSFTPVSVPA